MGLIITRSQNKDSQNKRYEGELELLLQDLKLLESHVEDLWQFLPIAVCLVNPVFNIVNASKALEEISGYGSLKIIGERLDNFFKNFKDIKRELAETETILGKETVFFTREKKETTVSLFAKTRKDEKGDITGYFFAFIDISREKLIERMKTEFVSIAAHQLRTPLSTIKYALNMMLGGDFGKLNKAQIDPLVKAYQSNEIMIALIRDLLDVARIEEGRYVYKRTLVDIQEMVRHVTRELEKEVEDKTITLEFKKSEEKLPKISVDVEKIRLAFQNLIENAINYTLPEGKVSVVLKHDDGNIEFLIKDTGIGIPKDQQGRVFGKFFRAANAMRKETRGSGLGLFITKNIIEAHGGKIWFESEENKGTTFHFTLPLKRSK